jgi:hypothetical protein
MTDVQAVIGVGAAQAPEQLAPPAGRVVWLNIRDASVADLVGAVQRCLPTDRLTVAVVWPMRSSTDPALEERGRLMTAVATGVVQSVQFELGAEGTTANVVVVSDHQVEDVQLTIDYFHGPDGGFVAGCTFDLRPVELTS